MNPTSRRICGRLYSRLPVFGQNAAISLYGLGYKRRVTGQNFGDVAAEFRNRDNWQSSRMQDYIAEKLEHMLLHAWDNVPYYRTRWSTAGLTRTNLTHSGLQALSLVPITPKSHLRLNPKAFLASTSANSRSHVRETTSGTTGEPIVVTRTQKLQQAFLGAREARSFGWAGTSILLPRATIGGRMVVPWAESGAPYYRYNYAERQCYFSAFHISPSHLDDYLEGFHRYRPRVLTGYASSYFSLARMMLARDLTLDYQPDALILWAEQLTPGMKRVIERAFRAHPYEEYSSVEDAALATECEHGNLHVSLDFGIIEICDEEGNPLAPGLPGRILCTSLLNDVQPLIRYDIGDFASLSPDPCTCGRDQFPVLRGLIGRVEDTIITPDGREIVSICSGLDLRHVLAIQIVQEALDLVKIRIIPATDFNEQDERLLKDTIASKRLGKMHIVFESVSDLERTAQGKVRRVIRRVNPVQDVQGRLVDKGAKTGFL